MARIDEDDRIILMKVSVAKNGFIFRIPLMGRKPLVPPVSLTGMKDEPPSDFRAYIEITVSGDMTVYIDPLIAPFEMLDALIHEIEMLEPKCLEVRHEFAKRQTDEWSLLPAYSLQDVHTEKFIYAPRALDPVTGGFEMLMAQLETLRASKRPLED